jgi:hypothetical protein
MIITPSKIKQKNIYEKPSLPSSSKIIITNAEIIIIIQIQLSQKMKKRKFQRQDKNNKRNNIW